MTSSTRCAGFTLLEVLVVLFIIGIITAMATLSIGVATTRKGSEKEIQRIQDLLALASEEAVLQGREFGITFYAKEYEFSTYDPGDGQWTPLGDEAVPFGPRRFPPETIVDLEIEHRIVKLAAEKPSAPKTTRPSGAAAARSQPRDEETQPQVFMLSSGDITPFTLRLRPAVGSRGISLRVAENGGAEQIRDER
jgi:general secretion pathway protein H